MRASTHSYIRTVAQRGVDMSRNDERGRVLSVDRVERRGVEVHRRVVREYDCVIARFAGMNPNHRMYMSSRRYSWSCLRFGEET